MLASPLVIQVAALFHSTSSLLALCIYLFLSKLVFHLLFLWVTLFLLSVRIVKMKAVGFEPTPFRNGALSHRLRPLGQTVLFARLCEILKEHVANNRALA